jgi:sulfur relay (sulfurtransferase) complex TusBCD TusD component (DsrE family)
VSSLADKGAEIIACGVCVNARGLQGGKDYVEGVRVGGLLQTAAWRPAESIVAATRQ